MKTVRRGLAALAVVVALAADAAAELYRWVGLDGTIHYTSDLESIPPAQRANAVAIGAPSTRGDAAPAPAANPGAEMPFVGGAPVVVDASLNGVPLRLMLDTGADRTLLSHAAIERAGLSLASGTPVSISGVTGSTAATLLTVPRLDVAGTTIGPLAVIVHTVSGTAVDGLLGRDVLDAFTFTVDGTAGRATLVPR